MSGVLRAVAADVGGTFTDLIGVSDDGSTVFAKVPSTPPNFEKGVLNGIAMLLDQAPGSVERVLHATTAGTNAVLERTGGPAALLTTAGFGDVLEIGRLRTPGIYDLGWEKPPPLIRRRRRIEVEGRLDANGSVHIPLDPGSVADDVDRLVDEGVRSFAIAFLHGSVDKAHEEAMRHWLLERHPGLFVTVASDLVAEPGEFERTSTAVLNAYLHPVVSAYLRRLAEGANDIGVNAPVYVMQSSGGLMRAESAADQPVVTLESGPAAGALAAAEVARSCDEERVVAFDMGGTTAKAALIQSGSPTYGSEFSVGAAVSAVSRLLRGGGNVVRLPVIDLAEVGAGGGSIAALDGGGGILVGPRSAGAVPGPACYGRGGLDPTVTDANMVLGFISPRGLEAGGVDVDTGKAESALMDAIGEPLGLGLGEAAWAVHTVANHQMVLALRAVTTERGRTISDHSLIAFGGSGAIHGATLAESLGMNRVIVPTHAGVLSARGLITAPAELSDRRAVVRPLMEVAGELPALVGPLADSLTHRLAGLGFTPESMEQVVSYDLRFTGQGSSLSVDTDGRVSAEEVLETFHRNHLETFGHRPEGEVILVAVRVAVKATWEGGIRPHRPPSPSEDSRRVWVSPQQVVEVAVIGREEAGDSPIKGPVLVDDPDTTTYVPPEWLLSMAGDGSSLLLERA